MGTELPELSVQQKWEIAEENLIYFVICGISYVKCHGGSAEDFGTWAGQVAAPSWEAERGKRASGLVAGISYNQQQFRHFEMEILEESATTIRARMRNFGEETIRGRPRGEITVDDYLEFFAKKWIVIADYLELEYSQHIEGDWAHFTVTDRLLG
jgi:hypothetical protein